MAKAKHIQVKDKSQLIIMAVAALALVGIIVATAVAIVNHRGSGALSAQTTINSITSYEPIALAPPLSRTTPAMQSAWLRLPA